MICNRIFLVGFMGAGKTLIGRELASRLGWRFMDLDEEIESAEKMAVRDIFANCGEPHFRELERKYLKGLSAESDAVVALGGGAYVDTQNRSLADSAGVTVWLKVSFDNVVHRVTMDGTRPLLSNLEQAKRLFEDRTPLYNLARIHVATDEREPRAIVDEILEQVKSL
jgi:shikimate kinase